jgi:hypothetical protein
MSKKNMKYITKMLTCYQIIRTIEGKQIYFGSVNHKKDNALKQVQRMRDVTVAMLDAGNDVDVIKTQIRSMDFSKLKVAKLFLESLSEKVAEAEGSASSVDETSDYSDFIPPEEILATETQSTSADSGVLESENIDVTANTETQLVSFTSLNAESLKQFSNMYATLKSLDMSEQDTKRFDEIFDDLDTINGTIDRLNSRLEEHLPHAELLFYKNEAKVLAKDKKSLQNRLTRAEKKLAV